MKIYRLDKIEDARELFGEGSDFLPMFQDLFDKGGYIELPMLETEEEIQAEIKKRGRCDFSSKWKGESMKKNKLTSDFTRVCFMDVCPGMSIEEAAAELVESSASVGFSIIVHFNGMKTVIRHNSDREAMGRQLLNDYANFLKEKREGLE